MKRIWVKVQPTDQPAKIWHSTRTAYNTSTDAPFLGNEVLVKTSSSAFVVPGVVLNQSKLPRSWSQELPTAGKPNQRVWQINSLNWRPHSREISRSSPGS